MRSTLLRNGPARQPVGDLWDYVSPSRLNLWLRCPLAFRFRYVERIPTPTSPSLLVGKMVHGALEYFNRQRQAGTTPPRRLLPTTWKRAGRTCWLSRSGPVPTA